MKSGWAPATGHATGVAPCSTRVVPHDVAAFAHLVILAAKRFAVAHTALSGGDGIGAKSS